MANDVRTSLHLSLLRGACDNKCHKVRYHGLDAPITTIGRGISLTAGKDRHLSRGRAVAAHRAHNPEVAGSSPAPATT